MIWHIVRFDFSGTDDDTRRDLEERLADLVHLEEVAWVRVARDISEPTVTGYISVFRTAEDLEAYRTHPEHVPVVEAIRDAGVTATRVDVETTDDPGDLPA